MREIKFRGKRVDNGEWIHGYYFKSWDNHYILWGTTNGNPNMIKVDPNTIGQSTGLKDKNGVDIYESDIVLIERDDEIIKSIKGIVKYTETMYVLVTGIKHPVDDKSFWSPLLKGYGENYKSYEVVGNIHDKE